MEVFSGYFVTISLISNYFCAFTAFVLLRYIFFSAILKIPTRVFLVTHYSLSMNREGFFLSINREKIRLFPSDFMRTYF